MESARTSRHGSDRAAEDEQCGLAGEFGTCTDEHMSWFQLDPESVVRRVAAAGGRSEIPTLRTSVNRGIVGFTVVSVAGFTPWAVFGHPLYLLLGEAGLYAVCAIVFIGLSGPLMHRLILGPGSLSRFYKLFSIAFGAYAAAWIGGWMVLHGNAGSWLGLLAGTAMMGWILSRAFGVRGGTLTVIGVLFGLNAAGYFGGGWLETYFAAATGLPLSRATQLTIARSLWGVGYGIGFGAGLGLAFHLSQSPIRAALRVTAPASPSGPAPH